MHPKCVETEAWKMQKRQVMPNEGPKQDWVSQSSHDQSLWISTHSFVGPGMVEGRAA